MAKTIYIKSLQTESQSLVILSRLAKTKKRRVSNCKVRKIKHTTSNEQLQVEALRLLFNVLQILQNRLGEAYLHTRTCQHTATNARKMLDAD